MKITDRTRAALAARREQRALLAEGWEHVGESGGSIWTVHRGFRAVRGERIIDARVASDGLGVWVKFGVPK